jgi:hypothetical protein
LARKKQETPEPGLLMIEDRDRRAAQIWRAESLVADAC